ncbi:MAG: DUF4262 domain-containing protein [Bacteroidota bacterium]
MNESDLYDKGIEASILETIEAHGVFIAFIESDGYNPSFGYSIGLFKQFQHPELIVMGLDSESTGAMIQNAKNEIEQGTRFMEGVNFPNFLVDYPVRFLSVDKAYYPDYLGYAGWYNQQSVNFPTLQMVWPDRDGFFPWEPEFNERFRFQQPLLDRNTTFKFFEEKNLGVFTTTEVLEGRPIRYVYHNEDGDWQFHSESEPSTESGVLVSLGELVKLDSTLNEIYFLNFGESAERTAHGEKWKISEKEGDG